MSRCLLLVVRPSADAKRALSTHREPNLRSADEGWLGASFQNNCTRNIELGVTISLKTQLMSRGIGLNEGFQFT